MTADPRPAAGTVDVTMTGDQGDVTALAAFIAELIGLAGDPGRIEIVAQSGPHPRRRSPSHRVYMTVRMSPGITGAAAQSLLYKAGARSVKAEVEAAVSAAIAEARAQWEQSDDRVPDA